jgi:hypothetical protein
VILGDATSVRADQLGGKPMIVSTSILSELRFAVANFGPGSVEADGEPLGHVDAVGQDD